MIVLALGRVEIADGADVEIVAKVDLRRYRILERGFHGGGADVRFGNRSGMSRPALLAEMRDDRRFAQDARGLERHEFGIAGTETEP